MPTYIEGFEIDAILNEDRTSECEITDHPVEKGVSITDHARLKPKVITLECCVSDTPIGALAERRGITLEDDPTVLGLSSGPTGDYIASDLARTWLEELQARRKPITVSKEWVRTDGSRGYKAFDNMMIQSLGENITADTGDAATFTVTLKQINYVTNSRTVVNVVTRAKKKVDKGNKPNSDAKAASKRRTTGLVDVTDATTSFVKNVMKDIKSL